MRIKELRKRLRISQVAIMLAPAIITSVMSVFISGIQLKNIQTIKASGDFATPVMIQQAQAECQENMDAALNKHKEANEIQFDKMYDRINKIYDFLIKEK